jgi:hypothetical protein
MSIENRFERFVTVTVLALSATCTRHRLPASSDGQSSAARADADNCLRYPTNVLPPVPDTRAAGGPHAVPRILVAASGRVVLLDEQWRILVWNPAVGREALLLPGAISTPVAGAGDVLFQRNSQGAVTRLALSSGALDAPTSDACGEAGVVSRIRGALDRPVVGLIPRARGGGAVIQFGEGTSPGCALAYEETTQGWTVEDVQASRDVLVITESGAKGASRAVFHYGKGSEDRAVRIDDLMNVELADDVAVFWSFTGGSVSVVSARDPKLAMRSVEIFNDLPINESRISVEAAAGRFLIFRNDCARTVTGKSPGIDRVLFDAVGGKVAARLPALAGPVGVTPNGHLVAALPEGVCVHSEEAGGGATKQP